MWASLTSLHLIEATKGMGVLVSFWVLYTLNQQSKGLSLSERSSFFYKCTVSLNTLGPRYIELTYIEFLHTLRIFFAFKYRWVPLKPDFLGAWKSVRLKHYPAYPIIIISLIIQRNLAKKIRAKWESGLTAVWLKWDPPVSLIDNNVNLNQAHIHSTLPIMKSPWMKNWL